MEKKIGHRSSADLEWQNVKKLCRERDKNQCVLCRLLNGQEYGEFMRSHPFQISVIQVAHYIPVGRDLGKTYDLDNVVCLCGDMHRRLDDMKNPLTGKNITRDEQEQWWQRIIKGRDQLNQESESKSVESILDQNLSKNHFDAEKWLDS